MTQNDLPPLRYELKLLGHSTDLPRVKAWLRLHPEGFQTSYPVRYVNSVCFDSPSAARLETHRAENGRRTKLRLRWYGALEGPAAAHWELKSREYTLGYKRSSPSGPPIDFCSASWPKIVSTLQEHCGPPVSLHLEATPCPALLVRYRREYLESADGRLRITLDTDLTMYDQQLSSSLNLTRATAPCERLILELEADKSEQARLARSLRGCPIPLSRHSKYFTGTLEGLSHLL